MFALSSNRIIFPDGIRKAFLIIEHGKIMDILTEAPSADTELTDLGNQVLMPGIIDPHVHINEPGRTHWEGFDTATKAALAGGITSMVEMPLNASPVTTTVDAFEQKLIAARGKLHTNCGFWGGVIPGNENELEGLVQKGVLGFKAFLTDSGIDEFPNINEADLRKAMPVIASHGLPLLVHCELSDDIIRAEASSASYINYLASRPAKWEDDAIALMIRLCEEFNCRTHIVHLSSSDSLKQIQKAKEKGLPLTVETAQHYLYFSAEQIPDGATEYKCAPPIRDKDNNQKLWEGLKSGLIDFTATDHSPAPPDMKETTSGDFMKAWGGISSIQLALPVLWTSAKEQGCTIADMAKWLSFMPSELAGLDHHKGRIAINMDADFTVWNPEASFTVSENEILHRHKLNPYTGEKLFGTVSQTWLKGEKLYDQGKFLLLNKGGILLG